MKKNLKVQTTDKYYLPIEFRSKLSVKFHLMYILVIAIFIFGVFITWNIWEPKAIIVKICALLFIPLFLYFWLYTGVLRRAEIKVDSNSVYIRSPYKTRTFSLNEIERINITDTNNIDTFQITVKEPENRSKLKKAILKGFGADPYEISVNGAMFDNVNFYELKAVINAAIQDGQTNN